MSRSLPAFILLPFALSLACTTNQDLGDHGQEGGGASGAGGTKNASGSNSSGSSTSSGEAPKPMSIEYGSFEGFVPASASVTAVGGGEALVSLTSETGKVGCALASDEDGAPGSQAHAVFAKLHFDSGDARCPVGVYAITSDPELCGAVQSGSPPDLHVRRGCALYKAWSSSGDQAAHVLATGGAIEIRAQESADGTVCKVDVDVRFARAQSLTKAFTFSFDPFGPGESNCAH